MTQNGLLVTVEESGDPTQGGASLEDFLRALEGVSRAMRLMVEHLGGREITRGQPPAWVREQSQLQIATLKDGSLAAELNHAPPPGKQLRIENLGPRAFKALKEWDGTEDSSLPKQVTECLYEAGSGLGGSARLYLGNRTNHKLIEVRRRDRASHERPDSEVALLSGWLKEVNWDRGTAQLHDYSGAYVRLRFTAEMGDEMLRLATQHVQVRGQGRINENDEWTTVEVQGLRPTTSWSEPFDLDAFLNDPNPKIFDPTQMVTIELTDEEREAFHRAIREGRSE
jgi:hypothetical protein